MQPSCRREKPAQEEIQKLLFRTGCTLRDVLCGLKEVKPCVFLPVSVEIVVDIRLVINSSFKW